jgi:hypothetical protein
LPYFLEASKSIDEKVIRMKLNADSYYIYGVEAAPLRHLPWLNFTT